MPSENTLAVFIDFENLALGFDGRRNAKFDIQMVLGRLVEKGKIIVKRAYADWGRFREYRAGLHEAAIELIEIPRRAMTGKNSADIRLVVDAMDLSYSKEHVGTFVIISGDSDFSPLVSKLKENGKHVIGLGMKTSTSDLLIDNCDEFIFYEDLERPTDAPVTIELKSVPSEKKKVMTLVVDAMAALRRENKEMIWSSMVKDTIKRKKPQFNESYYGYRTFSSLLEDAQRLGIITLTTDSRSGTYVVNEAGVKITGSGSNGFTPDRGRDRDSRREEGYRSESRGETAVGSGAPAGESGPSGYSREERWGRRRGRRGRWEERNRDGAQGGDAGYAGSAGAGSHAPASPIPAEMAVSAMDQETGMAYDAASRSISSQSISSQSVSSQSGSSEHASSEHRSSEHGAAESAPYTRGGSADADDTTRDEYGFPLFAGLEAGAPASGDVARDEDGFEAAAPAEPSADPSDDRTPEERELDARAARLAHSLETTASPSVAKKGTTGARRGARTGGTARGRSSARPAAAAATGEARPRARRSSATTRGSSSGTTAAAPAASSGRTRSTATRTTGGARRGTRKSS